MPHFPSSQLGHVHLDGAWVRSSNAVGSRTAVASPTTDSSTVAELTVADEVLVELSQGRNALEAIREGVHGTTVGETTTIAAEVTYGEPAMYWGMWFALDDELEVG